MYNDINDIEYIYLDIFTLNTCILIYFLNMETFRTNMLQLWRSDSSKVMSLYFDLQLIHMIAACRERTDLWQQLEVWSRTTGTRSLRANQLVR